jgi:hypothetical protein
MRPALLLAALATLAAAPAAAEPYDVPWFLANPRAHNEWLRQCMNDARLGRTAECDNARAAQLRRRPLGRPLPNSGPTPAEQFFYGARRS